MVISNDLALIQCEESLCQCIF